MPSDSLHITIRQALYEDHAFNDVTTRNLNFGAKKVKAVIHAKQDGVLAGVNVASRVFKLVDPALKITLNAKDGDKFKKGKVVLTVFGSPASILSAERTALNFLTLLSGVATLTRQFVDHARPKKVHIMDTRKTTPNLRYLEKYAVRMGGGYNQRIDLNDAVMVKENHIAALRCINKNISLADIIKTIRRKAPHKDIQIEVTTFKEFSQALSAHPSVILLDNMTIPEIQRCVAAKNKIESRVQLEVSGGVTLSNIRSFAATGVNRISIGALTHSPSAVDFSLDIVS